MPKPTSAHDLLQPGQSAMVLFTRGNHFEIHADGTGHSGNWKVNRERDVDRVIVYERRAKGQNHIYTALLAGFVGPNGEDRYDIRLQSIVYVGQTSLNWRKFADAGTNPIRYLST